jgi:hypothetical protein
MKIYIKNFNIEILHEILKKLSDVYANSETFIQIYSIDGIYKIDESTIKKQICVDKDIILFENYFNNLTLIADPSYYKTEIINNIIPEHISTKMKRCFFETNKNSNIKLVIEGEAIEKMNNYYGIVPQDIYFEILDNIDINNALIKKEIIVFLSLLN